MIHAELPLTRYPQDEQLTCGRIRVTRTWRPTPLRVPAHTHALTSMAVCLAGTFDESIGRQWHRVRPETLIVRPGGVAHANVYASGAPVYGLICELLPEALDVIRAETAVLTTARRIESGSVRHFGRQLDAEFRARDTLCSLSIEALVYELAIWTARRRGEGSTPRWLGRVQEFLRSEFKRTITLPEVAAIAGVHPSHLAKTFRRATGLTVGEYVRQLRVDYAASLLERGDRSLADVAVACGFYDQSHFSRVFARHVGLPPRRYVARGRK